MGTKPYFGQNKGVSFLWVVYKRGKDNKRFQGLKVSRGQGEKIKIGYIARSHTFQHLTVNGDSLRA